jgi:hypothetical protein
MSRLEEVGERDGWRCWICDEPVDVNRTGNDDRGPSIDSRTTKAKAKAGGGAIGLERLAHRMCNTRKGLDNAVAPWASHLFVIDPSPIIESVERLHNKGGRLVVARCPNRTDADEAAAWLLDRVSRLAPGLPLSVDAEPGGGQYMLVARV